MSRLDRQMEQVLKQPDLPADVKVQLFSQTLQRFLSFKNQLSGTTAPPTIAKTEEQPVSNVKTQSEPSGPLTVQQRWKIKSTPPEKLKWLPQFRLS